jgi:hypothetical protein
MGTGSWEEHARCSPRWSYHAAALSPEPLHRRPALYLDYETTVMCISDACMQFNMNIQSSQTQRSSINGRRPLQDHLSLGASDSGRRYLYVVLDSILAATGAIAQPKAAKPLRPWLLNCEVLAVGHVPKTLGEARITVRYGSGSIRTSPARSGN